MKAIGKGDDYFKDAILTADTAYHSSESIKKCEEDGIDAYIPDKDYRKRHPGLNVKKSSIDSRRRKFTSEDFRYDEGMDEYECPMGKRVKASYVEAIRHGGGPCIGHTGQMQEIVRCVRYERDALARKGKEVSGRY